MNNYSDKMNNALRQEVESGFVNGSSALVFKAGEEMFYGEYGYADKERGYKMQRDTIIRLFSMSKPITAVAVMVAYENGMLDLLDPVKKYLPEYGDLKVNDNGQIRPLAKDLTIMNLMTMTSGIPYGEVGPDATCSGLKMQELITSTIEEMKAGGRPDTRQMARRIAEVPTKFEPGTGWQYGYSADILGAVLEVASGMRLSAFYKKYIFDPLQMVDTGFGVPEAKRDRFAMNYEYDEKTGMLIPNDNSHLCEYFGEDVAFESGGAGLVSTIEDYSHFALMLANKGTYKGQRIISPASVSFIGTNHLNDAQRKYLDWDSIRGYGYGCLVRVLINRGEAGSNAPLGEFGWDGWTGNYVCVDPENEIVLLHFLQRRGAGGCANERLFRALTFSALT